MRLTIRAKRATEWVEVTHRYPLWNAVPQTERVTAEMINAHWTDRAAHYRNVELARVDGPVGCLVAVPRLEYRGKYLPCGMKVKAGHDLCKVHGGPSAA